MPDRILIVDGEEEQTADLALELEREGFRAAIAPDGRSALMALAQDPLPDLIVLELDLPDLPGTEISRTIRTTPRTKDLALIILTGKTDEIDRVVGFEVGADDYVVKPYSMREFMLRIKAVLRRARSNPGQKQNEIVFSDLRVSLSGHRVWVAHQEIRLTALEFKLLTTLLTRRGRVQSRETLLLDVWGIETDVATRTVDTHVKRLREKLGTMGQAIETVRGVGYRFRNKPLALARSL